MILRYLATGDNGGRPELDQQFATLVGVPPPQARAIADQYIQRCDQQLYTQESQAAAATSQAQEQAARIAQSEANTRTVEAQRAKSCAAVGGRYADDKCYSTVKDNPSGKAECVYNGTPVWVSFASDGTLDQTSYSAMKDYYPGCFR